MYCPICFNQTLSLASSGIVKVSFNHKSLATSQFFFDFKTETPKNIEEKFEKVTAEYFKFYSGFNHPETINSVELLTRDFKCSRGCKMTHAERLSGLNHVIIEESVKKIVTEQAKIYQLTVGEWFK